MQRRALFALPLAMAAAGASLPSGAQDKPPLKIVVGFPPGGSADVLARLMADALRPDFGAVVVENRPGAGGRIALNQVRRATPDGQTVVLLPSGPMVLFRTSTRSSTTTRWRILRPCRCWRASSSAWWPGRRPLRRP